MKTAPNARSANASLFLGFLILLAECATITGIVARLEAAENTAKRNISDLQAAVLIIFVSKRNSVLYIPAEY